MMPRLVLFIAVCLAISGCEALPRVEHQPQFHNPFPQLSRVAVLPFFNQSDEPTANGFDVATAYRNELQQIPGFEVMPVGVAEQQLLAHKVHLDGSTDFQALARMLNVDAVVVGSITDFTPFYPPRMGLAVNWYAANPCFHPIPPGYGLPWGTPEEEFIPDSLAFEAEFAQAREQLEAVSPVPPTAPLRPHSVPAEETLPPIPNALRSNDRDDVVTADHRVMTVQPARDEDVLTPLPLTPHVPHTPQSSRDPRGLSLVPGVETTGCVPHSGPIIELVRQYHGHDADFTQRLAKYYRFRDDARFGGWQSYLQRKDDFIRFCCYLHITETLAARGGVGKSRVVWKPPADRYER